MFSVSVLSPFNIQRYKNLLWTARSACHGMIYTKGFVHKRRTFRTDAWKLYKNMKMCTPYLRLKIPQKTLDRMYVVCSKRRRGNDNRIKYAFWTVENGRHFHKEQTAVLELCVWLRNRKSRSTTIFRKWKIEKLWVFSPWTRCVSTSDAFWSTCGVGIIYTGRKKVL